jgi:hypothetical protein
MVHPLKPQAASRMPRRILACLVQRVKRINIRRRLDVAITSSSASAAPA